MSVSSTERYPKRKRAEVNYAPEEDSEQDWESDEDFSSQLKKKVKSLPKNLPKHKIFPFMQLPPELRNKVYEYALSNTGVYITSKAKGYRRMAQRCIESECEPQYQSRWHRYNNRFNQDSEHESEVVERRSFVPNLLVVSKAVYAEAASYLYTQPVTVADNYALLSWLNQIGPKHTKMLRDITVLQWCGGRAHKSINFPALAMLTPATNLRRLNIACSVGYFSSYSWRGGKKQEISARVARKVFRDCYPFLEAFGRAKGDAAAGVELVEIDNENFSHSNKSIEEDLEAFRNELRRLLRT